MNFQEFFEQSLNAEQQQVVAPRTGVLMVTAGAGSGKTRVITARMAYLMVHHQVPASQIIALTFTNKAAKEMKERIARFLGHEGSLPYVGTFHSYCLRMLKSNSHLLPFKNFSLMDDADQEKIARDLITEKGLSKKLRPTQLVAYVSKLKNEATNDKEREELWGDDRLYRDLYYLYEERKKAAHCLDFDDLLLHALDLFKSHELFKKIFQEHVKHILVDEYQDTNKVQHALLKEMTKDEGTFALDSLCVVGDEDQSIYSWRGATVSNIINFSKDFPSATSITIERNYRSVQPILHIANEVIQHNTFRNPKKLYSGRDASDAVRILTCQSGHQESEALALFLKELRPHAGINSAAILYRSHFQSRSLEESLIRHSIPYKIIGGIQFYDRLEIKDMLAYLRVLVNPYDRLAFARAINKPSRGLGDKFEELFYNTWDMMPFESYEQVAQSLLTHSSLAASKAHALQDFLRVFEGLTLTTNPSKVLITLIERTGYYAYLESAFEKDEALAKKDNLKELINGVLFFEERHGGTLETFLQEVSLLQEHMDAPEENSDYVKLMTFHAAKGLEFDTVILSGIEEGILPSARSLYAQEALEEERRLLYVGITRARERLLITRSKFRYTYGQLTDQQPSRFLDEIPEGHVPQEDISYWKEYQCVEYFNGWILQRGKPTIQPVITDISYEAAFEDEPDDTAEWKRLQPVYHAVFGQGIIEQIEKKSSATHLTIRFRSGVKKLDASYISLL
jgi:DNA helicase-2/ATP-dependent DNA helicase PcrA